MGKSRRDAAGVGGASVASWRRASLAELYFVVLAAVVWFGPTVNPWYLIWALPFAALIGCWPWVVLTALSQLSYLYYLDQVERTWVLVLEHGTFAVLLAGWIAGRWSKRHS